MDKPAGVLSQKASVADFSANEWLIGYLLSQKKLTAEALATFHPSVCNRLDRNTSGLLLCGKSLLGTQKLTGLIRNRQIHKYYRLFLLGEVTEKQILNGYLLKDTKKNQVKILTKPAEGADEIKTGIEPLACLELPGIGTVTYAQAELFTGKTHQIRAHFAWAGHPLLGDPKYGNEAVNRTLKQTYGIGRQLLHAWQIRQKDGVSGILPTGGITCPLPEDFQKLLSDGRNTALNRRTKSLAATVDCTQPYRRLFIL
ncbi:MAG: RluA family pseudouridine synthase [Gallintestinimicrobium sp.]